MANSSISYQIKFRQFNQKKNIPPQKFEIRAKVVEIRYKALNELQALTLSGAIAVFAITWLFFGFGDDDDDGGGMMRPIRQNAE